MDRKKQLSLALSIVVILLLIFTLFFRNNSSKKIRHLTKELENTVDSLKETHTKYLLLEKEYKQIYTKLDSTRMQFNNFHKDLDSIMKVDINSLFRINRDLKILLEKEKPITKFEATTDTFRFR